MIEDLETEVERIKALIKDLYLSDSMPWIVGYSGGKDSTTCVQLIWLSLLELPFEKRRKPVHVISTDTLVENPVVAAWVRNSLTKMELAALKAKLPIFPHRLIPELKNRFWVNLIGKGYPAPRPKFRWCTERLKITTSTSFIQNLSETNGEAILVLGTRKAESSARAKTIEKYEGSSRAFLARNGDPKLSRVWVLAPIAEWSNDDVWEFIGTYENPWGVSSADLLELYRGATPDRECPVVVDTSTQSCGDSRFGCYVCTMVAQDKSMEAMILNDETKAWMKPILDFRDKYLAPGENERDHRDFKRLGNNRLILMRNELVHGPYTQAYRHDLLKNLLEAQKVVQQQAAENGYGHVELISREELDEIRRIWVEEKGEIEDTVPKIYERVFGQKFDCADLVNKTLASDDIELLKEVASQWTRVNIPAAEEKITDSRCVELYELTRTLLATSFKRDGKKHRSKQLDEVGKILERFSFIDEEQATAFARQFLNSNVEENSDIPIDTQSTKSIEQVANEEALPANRQELLI